MYCPQCGQERTSHETSFCSRCGFLLTGAAELLHTGGAIPAAGTKPTGIPSPRTRGLKQGLFIFLLTFLVVPIMAILMVWLHTSPFAMVISAISLFVGGLLRMAYALLFETTIAGAPTLEDDVIATGHEMVRAHPNLKVLPAQQSIPLSSYVPPQAGKWRDTNELQPTSVTESTTRLLEKDQ